MKGRIPKPQAVKDLAGNPGHRKPRGASLELHSPLGSPPAFLTPLALQEWHDVMRVLGATGVIQQVDKALLAAWCMSYARWQEAEAILLRDGMLLEEPVMNSKGELKGHRVVKHAAVSIAKDEKAAMRSLGGLFGLDPTNRPRIIVQKQPLSPEEKMSRFLDGDDDAFKTN